MSATTTRDPRAEAVAGDVVAGKRRKPRIALHQGDLDVRHAPRDGEAHDTHAGSDIEHPLAALRRQGRRQQDGIQARPIAAQRLPDAQRPAEERIFRGGVRKRVRKPGMLTRPTRR